MTAESAPTPVYHPVIDQILTRLLADPGAAARIRKNAEQPGSEPLTALVHTAALRAAERDHQLARKIKHTLADLQAAERELADGRSAEHLLTGRHDDLLALTTRHHDALAHLEAITRAHAAAERAEH
jgi:hypothetical protein